MLLFCRITLSKTPISLISKQHIINRYFQKYLDDAREAIQRLLIYFYFHSNHQCFTEACVLLKILSTFRFFQSHASLSLPLIILLMFRQKSLYLLKAGKTNHSRAGKKNRNSLHVQSQSLRFQAMLSCQQFVHDYMYMQSVYDHLKDALFVSNKILT